MNRSDVAYTDAPSLSSAVPAARDELFDLLNGYWRTQPLCTAAELGIADVLTEGPCDVASLAHRTSADAGSLARLLRALVGFGVVARTPDAGTSPPTAAAGWSVQGGRLARPRPVDPAALVALVGRAGTQRAHRRESTLEHVFGAPLFGYLVHVPDTGAVFPTDSG